MVETSEALPTNIPINEICKKFNGLSFNILNMLSQELDLSFGIIKEKLNLSQEKTSKELAKLESPLFIESYRDQIDARCLKYKITTYGLAALNTKEPITNKII